ncbi:MAG: hypothetical protein AAF138_11315 [Planctomycetota bacterium]
MDASPKTDEPVWDVERFVAEFISSEPVTKAKLREQAKGVPGLSWRRVADLLDIAEGEEQIQRVRLPGRGGRWGFALPDEERSP